MDEKDIGAEYMAECLICGEERGCQRAHLANGYDFHRTERRKQLEPIVILCPVHHYCYDHKGLRVEELNKLPLIFRNYYLSSEVGKVFIVSKAIKRQRKNQWKIFRRKRGGKPVDDYYAKNAYTKEVVNLGTADGIFEAVKGMPYDEYVRTREDL